MPPLLLLCFRAPASAPRLPRLGFRASRRFRSIGFRWLPPASTGFHTSHLACASRRLQSSSPQSPSLTTYLLTYLPAQCCQPFSACHLAQSRFRRRTDPVVRKIEIGALPLVEAPYEPRDGTYVGPPPPMPSIGPRPALYYISHILLYVELSRRPRILLYSAPQ